MPILLFLILLSACSSEPAPPAPSGANRVSRLYYWSQHLGLTRRVRDLEGSAAAAEALEDLRDLERRHRLTPDALSRLDAEARRDSWPSSSDCRPPSMPIRQHGLVLAPMLVERVPADTVPGVTGIAILETRIDRHGRVVEARILKGLGEEADRSAVAAARRWRFAPALLCGQPVEVFFNLTVRVE